MTDIDNVNILALDAFTTSTSKYRGKIQTYTMKESCSMTNNDCSTFKKSGAILLKIQLLHKEHHAIIEFSGKILREQYPKLISIYTIYQCFKNINDLSIISIDLTKIMDFEVMSCDITRDISIPNCRFSKITGFLLSHIVNYKRYNAQQQCKNNNLIIKPTSNNKENAKTLTIYNKEKEMQRLANKCFMQDYCVFRSIATQGFQ